MLTFQQDRKRDLGHYENQTDKIKIFTSSKEVACLQPRVGLEVQDR